MEGKYLVQYLPVNEPMYIELPASKSLSNRALIIQHLCKEPFAILNLSEADDTINLLQNLSSGSESMYLGAAGTNMRFLISCLSITPGNWRLMGSERLNQRPVGDLVKCLQQMGADIDYLDQEGFPPLTIHGRELEGGEVTLSGRISSQFISSVLMIAPKLNKGLILHLVDEVVSRPYIQMTLDLLNYFGIKYSWINQTIIIEHQDFVTRDYRVEPDWSGASFWYAFTAITGRQVVLKDLSLNSLQGDKRMAEYGKLLGVQTTSMQGGITLQRSGSISSRINLNLINEPDLFPVLAFTAAALKIPASFTGLQTLNLKESARIESVTVELLKLNVKLNKGDDFFELQSFGEWPASVTFQSYNDHRMIIAASVVGLLHRHVMLENPKVVSKSYPGFWNDLKRAGYSITEA